MRTVTHAVGAGFKEFIEDIVFVRGHHKLPQRQSHLLRNPPGKDISEVTRRHRHVHRVTGFSGHLQVTRKVVDDLSGHTRPVDGIHGPDTVRGLIGVIVTHGLHNVLRIIKCAFDGNIEDVFVRKRIHLRALKGAHAARGRQHKDADSFPAAHRVFGGRPRVA